MQDLQGVREPGPDLEAAVGPRPGLDVAADDGHPLLDADQAVAATGLGAVERARDAVVGRR